MQRFVAANGSSLNMTREKVKALVDDIIKVTRRGLRERERERESECVSEREREREPGRRVKSRMPLRVSRTV